MRYVVALLMAGLILLALIAFRRHVAAEFQDTIRQAMREAKAAGDPALADVDPETHPSTDFGTDVSSNLKFKINVADLLQPN